MSRNTHTQNLSGPLKFYATYLVFLLTEDEWFSISPALAKQIVTLRK